MKRTIKQNGLLTALSILFLSSVWGCYTSFQHPPINDSNWGQVHFSDDCTSCHNQQPYSNPILPKGTKDDQNWQFYSSSPWWQDEFNYIDAPIAAPESTGPRRLQGSSGVGSMPVAPAPVQSLGKSGADAEPESTTGDNRRKVGRRTDTRSDSNSSGKSRGSSRSRRSQD